ncbi:hypothetical protein KKF34_14270 [Myxococcota bacterium]|nr:hypothetical protein [Myxococcota bacterium]MBU1380733.1 hypothetical protein [Myxococcota bacterium]MBU1498039.1 hypothetical protein [Myxococcota bacterium]
MAKISPLQIVKEKFGSKEELAKKVVDLIAKGKEEKDNLQEKLRTAANTQLLRLYEIAQEVQTKYKTKEGMVERILELQNKVKDLPHKEKLLSLSLPRLLDMVKRFEKKQ